MCHNGIMRTTVNIPDHLLVEAKKLAATKRTSLASIFEDSLRLYLTEHRSQSSPPSGWALPLSDAGKPVPGLDLNDVSELLDL